MDNHGEDWIYIGDLKSKDAREALRRIAERVKRGEVQYGPLELDADARDFDEEQIEESADKVVYNEFETMKRLRRRIRAKDREVMSAPERNLGHAGAAGVLSGSGR